MLPLLPSWFCTVLFGLVVLVILYFLLADSPNIQKIKGLPMWSVRKCDKKGRKPSTLQVLFLVAILGLALAYLSGTLPAIQ